MSIRQAVLEAMSPEQIIRLKKLKAWLQPLPEYHDRTKSIFIHIPKAAGMSMVSALYGIDSSVHDTWREYYRRSPSKFKAYFKFSIVRNPEDRVISAYNYLMAGGKSETDAYWKAKYIAQYNDVSDFVQYGLVKAMKGGAEHFFPQNYFICDRFGRLKVDYLGRFENLDRDVDFIFKRLNIKSTFPELNRVRNAKNVSLTAGARKALKKIYCVDYDLFYKEAINVNND